MIVIVFISEIFQTPQRPALKLFGQNRIHRKNPERSDRYPPKNSITKPCARQNILPEFFQNNFLRTKLFIKTFHEQFPQKVQALSEKSGHPFHAVNPSQNPPCGPPFFAVQSDPNPAPGRAPIPHFSRTEPHTCPDLDPPTPCFVQKS